MLVEHVHQYKILKQNRQNLPYSLLYALQLVLHGEHLPSLGDGGLKLLDLLDLGARDVLEGLAQLVLALRLLLGTPVTHVHLRLGREYRVDWLVAAATRHRAVRMHEERVALALASSRPRGTALVVVDTPVAEGCGDGMGGVVAGWGGHTSRGVCACLSEQRGAQSGRREGAEAVQSACTRGY